MKQLEEVTIRLPATEKKGMIRNLAARAYTSQEPSISKPLETEPPARVRAGNSLLAANIPIKVKQQRSRAVKEQQLFNKGDSL